MEFRFAIAAALAVSATPAFPAAAGAPALSANGYVLVRAEAVAARADTLLGRIAAQPPAGLLLEQNLQARLRFAEGADLVSDFSLLSSAWAGSAGVRTALTGGNAFVVNELHQIVPAGPSLSVQVGKKRLVFGSGWARNPSDLLNRAKDPTDPSLQRQGAWLAAAEWALARAAATLFFAPRIFAEEAGLPRRFLHEGDGDGKYLAGARGYALVADTDVTLLCLYTDRFGDTLRRPHAAISLARNVGEGLETHAEALAHRGSARTVVDPACVGGPPGDLVACAQDGAPDLFIPTHAGSNRIFLRALLGARYLFADGALLSVEYDGNGEGLDRREFQDRVRLLRRAGEIARSGTAPAGAAALLPAILGSAGPDSARLAFEPVRRHYVIASFQRPRIRDDFTLGANLVLGLEDLSGIAGASAAWSAREWLSLSLFAAAPFGARESEFGALPHSARLSFDARMFY